VRNATSDPGEETERVWMKSLGVAASHRRLSRAPVESHGPRGYSRFDESSPDPRNSRHIDPSATTAVSAGAIPRKLVAIGNVM
jgi:hypothetical protein